MRPPDSPHESEFEWLELLATSIEAIEAGIPRISQKRVQAFAVRTMEEAERVPAEMRYHRPVFDSVKQIPPH